MSKGDAGTPRNGPLVVYPKTALDMLQAEGLIRKGQFATAAALINVTRIKNGFSLGIFSRCPAILTPMTEQEATPEILNVLRAIDLFRGKDIDELTEWLEECWAPLHTTGYQIRLCTNCDQIVHRKTSCWLCHQEITDNHIHKGDGRNVPAANYCQACLEMELRKRTAHSTERK